MRVDTNPLVINDFTETIDYVGSAAVGVVMKAMSVPHLMDVADVDGSYEIDVQAARVSVDFMLHPGRRLTVTDEDGEVFYTQCRLIGDALAVAMFSIPTGVFTIASTPIKDRYLSGGA